MKNPPSRQLLEKIPHITNSAPYSLHRTDFMDMDAYSLYLHFHPEYELLYLAEGAMEVTINSCTHRLAAGEALFIPPNLLHSATALSGTGTFYAVVFSEHLLTATQEHISSYLTNEPDNTKYICKLSPEVCWQQELLFYLTKIFPAPLPLRDSDVFVKSHILIIWEYLYQYHISFNQEKDKPNTPVKDVLDFIHNNYQEEFTLEDLAEIAHTSKEHLCRIFKKSTGYTPISYLKQYRILQSCHYLKDTDKKISEICTLVGFNNISYFNREFLRVLQTTPSNYRSRE